MTWTRYEILPLTKKMREKVKQYGSIWWVRKDSADRLYSLRTTIVVHSGRYPYERWAELGKDFNLGAKID